MSKKHVHTLIKKYFITKNANHYLSLQQVIIFLLVEGLKYCENYQNTIQMN